MFFWSQFSLEITSSHCFRHRQLRMRVMYTDQEENTAFEMRTYRRLFRLPWTARRTNKQVWDTTRIRNILREPMALRKLRYFWAYYARWRLREGYSAGLSGEQAATGTATHVLVWSYSAVNWNDDGWGCKVRIKLKGMEGKDNYSCTICTNWINGDDGEGFVSLVQDLSAETHVKFGLSHHKH